jgi:hypothetical protein
VGGAAGRAAAAVMPTGVAQPAPVKKVVAGSSGVASVIVMSKKTPLPGWKTVTVS